jgi:hypothetical protein
MLILSLLFLPLPRHIVPYHIVLDSIAKVSTEADIGGGVDIFIMGNIPE